MNLKMLMVSTEYPPMHGGVGRYCERLVSALRKKGVQVLVVCNEQGSGDYKGISPHNKKNSRLLLELVKETKPDLVHVQFEQGLYGVHLNPINPLLTRTGLDPFYDYCNVPIVTTFHSAYNFKQWMNLVVPLNRPRLGRAGTYLRMAYDYWTHLVNYRSFNQLNKQKLGPKRAGIVFSNYLANLIPGTQLIYHGADPSVINPPSRKELRRLFSLPEEANIALASGFMTATKGWDVIRKMKVPEGWKIVVNSSRNYYNTERHHQKFDNPGVIDLQRGYLDEEQLSMLFHSADALILPYKVTSGSGVMFDGFAHGLPFVSSNIGFFKEFSEKHLGISVKRGPSEFSNALVMLENDMEVYQEAVKNFKKKLTWEEIATKHILLYQSLFRIIKSPDQDVAFSRAELQAKPQRNNCKVSLGNAVRPTGL